MDQVKIKKACSFVLFLVLAGISCWATEHSLHLLLAKIRMPEVFIWGLTIALFVVASYGTKMVVDALNKDIYLDHRRRTFWVGTVLVIVFWLFFSMPTNTHTFFYNSSIGTVLKEDISTTNGYLTQIKDRTNIDSTYFEKVYDPVMKIYKDMAREFNGIGYSGQKGNGQYVHDAIDTMNGLLKAYPHGTSVVFINRWNVFDPSILQSYQNQTEASLEKILDEDFKVAKTEASNAAEAVSNLESMSDTIKVMLAAGNIHEDVVIQTETEVLGGYTCVKNNNRFVKFENEKDEKLYTAENLETRIQRLLSVWDVWGDFLCGKYPLAFLYYILLSILVDVAAFLFFDFTFKKEE